MNATRTKALRRFCKAIWTPKMTRAWQVSWSESRYTNPFGRFYRYVKRYWARHGRLPSAREIKERTI